MFSILRPEASTNLVTNPQVYIDLVGYTAIGGATSIARTLDQQRRGVYGLEVSPVAGVGCGVYYTIGLTAEQVYTFSVDVWAPEDYTMYIYIADNAGTRLTENVTFEGSGFWVRKAVTYRAKATANHRLYVWRVVLPVPLATQKFYTDGWQLENLNYATTYIDGDQEGYIANQTAYGWNGAAHSSTSYRVEDTKAGGREINLADPSIGYLITGVVGLGHAPVSNLATSLQSGGSRYDSTIYDEREFSLVGQFNTGDQYPEIHKRRAALLNLVRWDKTETPQPITLVYRPIDPQCKKQVAEDVTIACLYTSGLEGSLTNYNQEKVALNFVDYLPGVKSVTENGIDLDYNSDLANVNYCVRLVDSVFDNLNNGVTVGTDVYVIKHNPVDGLFYFGGSFTTIGGVAANYVASYDPVTDAFAALGVGTSGVVRDLDFDGAGNVYVTGNFANAGGAAANHVAKWDISLAAWFPIGPIPGLNSQGYSIAVAAEDSLWIGLLWNSAAIRYTIVMYWNGAAWSSVWDEDFATVPRNPRVVLSPDGQIYGCRTRDEGANSVSRVYDGDNFPIFPVVAGAIGVWNTVGAGLDGVTAMEFDSAGNLYVAGNIEGQSELPAPYTVEVNAIAKWNGTAWSALAGGLVESGGVPAVHDLLFHEGNLYAVGFFDSSDGLTLDGQAYWNGSSWNIPPSGATELPGAQVLYTIEIVEGDYYLGFNTSGTAVVAGTNTITSTTQSPTYPIIEYKGPMQLFTTLKGENGIQYLPLVLATDEVGKLILEPGEFSFESVLSGNLQPRITDGSQADKLILRNGANTFLAFANNYIYEFGDTNGIASSYEDMTGITGINTANGKLYLRGVVVGPNLQISFYLEAGLTTMVAQTPDNAIAGPRVVNPIGGSGIGGTINIDAIPGAPGNYDWQVTWGLIHVRWFDRYSGIDELL
jgi:hypothetical protein